MKVLWITNIIFPAPSKVLGMLPPACGGWMISSLETLRSSFTDLEFAVATVYSGHEFKSIKIDNVTYYLLPMLKSMTEYDKTLEPLWRSINDEFKPDVTHIHGTEFAHGLAYIRACGAEKVCVSIQGLVSVISRYYYADISVVDILKNITFRDIVKLDTIFHQKSKFEKRGKLEKMYIKTVSHVIGRTNWDKSHVWAINPDVNYHIGNETLRPSFYNHKWEYSKCEKHTIFLSQSCYPVKGVHKVLEAMPLILRIFPDTRLRIAGDNIIDKPFYRICGYGKYLRSLINKFNLQEKIMFLGTLSEIDMCEEYLKANVFVCPSSIENSPNSLGEAQLLGVPHLASYVGGTMDMMQGEEYGLYRFEEVEALADKICSIFKLEDNYHFDSTNNRYDSEANAIQLISIYNKVLA